MIVDVVVTVPSETIHFEDEQYRYILETKEEDQTVSERAREVFQAGIEREGG